MDSPTKVRAGFPALRTFSLAHGPFVTVLRRAHLVRRDETPRTRMLVLIAWLPLCLGAMWRVTFGERPQPILFDISVHVRLLVVIPLVILAERLLEARCRGAIEQLYEGALAPAGRLDPIVDRAERLRDSRLAELVLVALAVIAGQAALWGAAGPTGLFAGVREAGAMSFARIWYGFVALPIVQFLMLRWIWHWAIWSYVVVRVSRLPLAMLSTHPDHAGGIAFLGGPITAFAAYTFAFSSMLAGAWGTQILRGHATMQTFIPSFVGFVVAAAIVACGPQLLFIGALYRARHRDKRVYSAFALEYVRDFHRKWIEERTAGELGSQDIQALNDLGGSFGTLEKTRLVPVGPRSVGSVWIAALIPMLPIVTTAMPVAELARHVGSAMLGGIPL